jgi:hypothetical protein
MMYAAHALFFTLVLVSALAIAWAVARCNDKE